MALCIYRYYGLSEIKLWQWLSARQKHEYIIVFLLGAGDCTVLQL